MKINFGCGSIQPSDWINIDLDPEFKTEHRDLSSIIDNSCDIIVCHAIICCVKYHDIEKVLAYLDSLKTRFGI
jgi:predicted SAM-dependent methyltransferase